jgi:hypothetical protein
MCVVHEEHNMNGGVPEKILTLAKQTLHTKVNFEMMDNGTKRRDKN